MTSKTFISDTKEHHRSTNPESGKKAKVFSFFRWANTPVFCTTSNILRGAVHQPCMGSPSLLQLETVLAKLCKLTLELP